MAGFTQVILLRNLTVLLMMMPMGSFSQGGMRFVSGSGASSSSNGEGVTTALASTDKDGRCSLCPVEGTRPPREYYSVVALTHKEHERAATTCGELINIAPSFFGEDCASLHVIGVTKCGCSNEEVVVEDLEGTNERVCTPCADPDASHSMPGRTVAAFEEIPGKTPTCSDLTTIANEVPSLSDEDCRNIQMLGSYFCGCPPIDGNDVEAVTDKVDEDSTLDVVCPLCWDGSDLHHPNGVAYTAPAREGEGLVEVTCRQLSAATAQLDFPRDQCGPFQVIAAASCGCPPPPRNVVQCPLCRDSSIPEEDLLYSVVPMSSGESSTCFDLMVAAAASKSAGECATLQQAGVQYCGCDDVDDIFGDESENQERAPQLRSAFFRLTHTENGKIDAASVAIILVVTLVLVIGLSSFVLCTIRTRQKRNRMQSRVVV